jgi:hypothetical protein
VKRAHFQASDVVDGVETARSAAQARGTRDELDNGADEILVSSFREKLLDEIDLNELS